MSDSDEGENQIIDGGSVDSNEKNNKEGESDYEFDEEFNPESIGIETNIYPAFLGSETRKTEIDEKQLTVDGAKKRKNDSESKGTTGSTNIKNEEHTINNPDMYDDKVLENKRDIRLMCAKISKMIKLRELVIDLDHNSISAIGLKKILEKALHKHELLSFSLHINDLVKPIDRERKYGMKDCSNKINNAEFSYNINSLYINLERKDIGDIGIKYIGAAIKSLQKLKIIEIHIQSNAIFFNKYTEDIAFKAINQNISKALNLKAVDLDLSGNRMTKHLLQNLIIKVSGLKALEKLALNINQCSDALSFQDQIFEPLKNLTHLRNFSLKAEGTNVSKEVYVSLCDFLEKAKQLELLELDLSKNSFPEEKIKSLGSIIHDSVQLKEIKLNIGNSFGNNKCGCESILKGKLFNKQNPRNLSSLEFEGLCKLGKHTLKDISMELSNIKTLTSLKLTLLGDSEMLTSIDIDQITENIRMNGSLKTLSITFPNYNQQMNAEQLPEEVTRVFNNLRRENEELRKLISYLKTSNSNPTQAQVQKYIIRRFDEDSNKHSLIFHLNSEEKTFSEKNTIVFESEMENLQEKENFQEVIFNLNDLVEVHNFITDKFIKALPKLTAVTSLNFQITKVLMDENFFSKFFSVIQYFKNIKRLSFDFEKNLKPLNHLSFLKDIITKKDLSFGKVEDLVIAFKGMTIDFDAFSALVNGLGSKRFPILTKLSLDFSDSKLDEKTLSNIFPSFGEMPKLNDFMMFLTGSNQPEGESMKKMFDCLALFKALKSIFLDFSKCRSIGEKEIESLSTANFEAFKQLKSLDLFFTRNLINDQGLQKFGVIIKEKLKFCKLETLLLTFSDNPVSGVSFYPFMTSLSESVHASSLKEARLYFRGTKINELGCEKLANFGGKFKALTNFHLDLSSTQVNHNTTKSLITTLLECKTLEFFELKLGRTPQTDEVLGSLEQILKKIKENKIPKLVLKLENCSITQAGFNQLADILRIYGKLFQSLSLHLKGKNFLPSPRKPVVSLTCLDLNSCPANIFPTFNNMQQYTCFGLDLGSAFSVLSTIKKTGPEIILNDSSNRESRNIVTFKDKERFVDEQSYLKYKQNFQNTILCPSRFLRFMDSLSEEQVQREREWITAKTSFELRTLPITDHGQVNDILFTVEFNKKQLALTAMQIVATILQKLKALAYKNRVTSGTPSFVVSLPPFFKQGERILLEQACKIVGLNLVGLISEPAAISFNYLVLHKEEISEPGVELNILFVDVGHSKTGIFLTKFFDKNKAEVQSQSYDSSLGARDIDWLLFQHLEKYWKTQHPKQNIQTDTRTRIRLFEAIEKLRKVLSANNEAVINIESFVGEDDFNYTMNRQEFENIVKPFTEKFRKLIESFKNNNNPLSFKKVELIGGASRIPLIQKTIEGLLKTEECSRTINSSECVAIGCVLKAASKLIPLWNKAQCTILDRNFYRIFYTFKVIGGALRLQEETHILFDVNAVLPAKNKIIIPNLSSDESRQVVLSFHYESGEILGVYSFAGSTGVVAMFQVDVLIDESSKIIIESIVEETFVDSPEGTDNLTGSNFSRKTISYTVKWNGAIYSDKEVKEFTLLEEWMNSEEKKVHEAHEAGNALEAYIYDLRRKLDDEYKTLAKEEERSEILGICKEIEEWVYNDRGAKSKKEFDDQKAALEKKLGERLSKYNLELSKRRTEETIVDSLDELKRLAATNTDKKKKKEIKSLRLALWNKSIGDGGGLFGYFKSGLNKYCDVMKKINVQEGFTLELGGNSLSDKGMEYIMDILNDYKHLWHVDIDFESSLMEGNVNSFTDPALEKLVLFLMGFVQLRRLRLNFIRMSSWVFEMVLKLVIALPYLEDIMIRINRGSIEEELRKRFVHLGKELKKIKLIKLEYYNENGDREETSEEI